MNLSLAGIITVAKGEKPGDLLLKNAKVVNVFTGEIEEADVVIVDKYIAGIGNYSEAKQVINLKHRYLIPGLMDAHLHLESTLLTPAAFAASVLPHGTTSVFIDPHEIANVLGINGINYLLKATEDVWLNFFILIPSCVPATHLETAGAEITATDIAKLLHHPRVVGLAEMMNYPGVLNRDNTVLQKIKTAQRAQKVIDGHAPFVRGKDLQAYVSAGIDSDHETTRLDEAKEKLAAGMWLMIREGTAAKNLHSLLPAVNAFSLHRCLFCTDDKEAADLLKEGHIDYIIRLAIKAGLNPVWAIKMATFNCAQRFGLKGIGAIAPGYIADMAVVEDLENFEVVMTIKDGEVVFEEGVLKVQPSVYVEPQVTNTINIAEITPESFKLKITSNRAHVIGLVEGQIVTEHLIKEVKRNKQGEVISDPDRDILKMAVIERHQASGNIGLGLLSGLGLKRGAIAQTVAHDSHNLIVVGTNDQDMYVAVKAIKAMQGGFVVVENGMVKAGLSLPIAGLISPLKAEEVALHMEQLCATAKQLGVILQNPFLSLAFVALPVIPKLRLTDKGLVDVEKFAFIPLEAT